jgi:hypothetical protein
MTEMTDICELSNTELDVVCGGALFNGPLVVLGPIGNVAIVNSFDTQLQSNSNIGVIAGNIGSAIGLGQLGANLGLQPIGNIL